MIDTPWLERAKINLLRLSENKDNFFKEIGRASCRERV